MKATKTNDVYSKAFPHWETGKFKVGDRVRNKETGALDVVIGVPGTASYDAHPYMAALYGMELKREGGDFQHDYEFVTRLSSRYQGRGRPRFSDYEYSENQITVKKEKKHKKDKYTHFDDEIVSSDKDYRTFATVLFYLALFVGFFFLMAHYGLSDSIAVNAGFAH